MLRKSYRALMASRVAIAAVAIAAVIVSVRSAPVSADPFRCKNVDPLHACCPPNVDPSVKIVDFRLKPGAGPLRVRKPAHALSQEEADRYRRALAIMRGLPKDDPWNFLQQANVHCAYCNGGRLQLGLNITLEIHGSWLFMAWHRAFLYFHELILGRLLNDASFALPFWNWDDPSGMALPPIYRPSSSSLFNPTRYPSVLQFINLGKCSGPNTAASLPDQKRCNLRLMRRQFVGGSSPSLFYGGPYRSGDPPFPGAGPIETAPHNPVHDRTGSDMLSIPTAARDPVFYAHHANIDRLWDIWQAAPGANNLPDDDFLGASFFFWDDHRQYVRVRVRDLLDPRGLGYAYHPVPLQWMNQGAAVVRQELRAEPAPARFPLRLNLQASFALRRKPRGEEEERLVVSDIRLDGREAVWFEVYIGNLNGSTVEAGCFVHLRRSAAEEIRMATNLVLGIRQFLIEIGIAGDERVLVTLVPKVGGDKVSVGGVSID